MSGVHQDFLPADDRKEMRFMRDGRLSPLEGVPIQCSVPNGTLSLMVYLSSSVLFASIGHA
jgi:hypothetical protein